MTEADDKLTLPEWIEIEAACQYAREICKISPPLSSDAALRRLAAAIYDRTVALYKLEAPRCPWPRDSGRPALVKASDVHALFATREIEMEASTGVFLTAPKDAKLAVGRELPADRGAFVWREKALKTTGRITGFFPKAAHALNSFRAYYATPPALREMTKEDEQTLDDWLKTHTPHGENKDIPQAQIDLKFTITVREFREARDRTGTHAKMGRPRRPPQK